MIECESDNIQTDDLPYEIRMGGSQKADSIANKYFEAGQPTLEKVKNSYILQVIRQCKTDQEAADMLDVSRRTITRFKKEGNLTSNS